MRPISRTCGGPALTRREGPAHLGGWLALRAFSLAFIVVTVLAFFDRPHERWFSTVASSSFGLGAIFVIVSLLRWKQRREHTSGASVAWVISALMATVAINGVSETAPDAPPKTPSKETAFERRHDHATPPEQVPMDDTALCVGKPLHRVTASWKATGNATLVSQESKPGFAGNETFIIQKWKIDGHDRPGEMLYVLTPSREWHLIGAVSVHGAPVDLPLCPGIHIEDEPPPRI